MTKTGDIIATAGTEPDPKFRYPTGYLSSSFAPSPLTLRRVVANAGVQAVLKEPSLLQVLG